MDITYKQEADKVLHRVAFRLDSIVCLSGITKYSVLAFSYPQFNEAVAKKVGL